MGRPGLAAEELVGAAGFEPTTLSSRTIRATKLRHAPTGCPLSQGQRMIPEAVVRAADLAGSARSSVTPPSAHSSAEDPASPPLPGRRAGSGIGTTASAAKTNEIAINQNTIGSPA